MSANWAAGLMRWQPYVDAEGKAYPLLHLHPFRYQVQLPAKNGSPQLDVWVHVGFALHCFTRATASGDSAELHYSDDREVRAFCFERYALSRSLPDIARSLQGRPCFFAKHDNYVTLEQLMPDGTAVTYGAFFNLKREAKDQVMVVFQSAYAINPQKPQPAGKGRIGFNALLGHTLRGTKPKKP